MISLTPQMRILLATAPVDFRKGIDGLQSVCRKVLKEDPFSGYLFVFRNRRGSSIRILVYDGQGFWLAQKRLSTGRFSGWPESGGEAVQALAVHELQVLMWNGDPKRVSIAPAWRRLPTG